VEGEGEGLNCGRPGGGVAIYRCWVRARGGSLIAGWKRFLIAVRSDGWVCIEEAQDPRPRLWTPLIGGGDEVRIILFAGTRYGSVTWRSGYWLPWRALDHHGVVYGPKCVLKWTTQLTFNQEEEEEINFQLFC
jgi:hypothetical protein